MNRFLRIAGSVLVWVALAAYLLWAVRQCSTRERDIPARGVEVTVLDSARLGVITPGMVKAWIEAEKLIPPNIAAKEIPVGKIEKLVRSRGFVKQAKVYVDLNGVTHIELRQRRPVLRINTTTGYDIYLTEDHYVLPVQAHAAIWLPVITGNYTPPFAKNYVGPLAMEEKNVSENYLFLYKLINFVGFLAADDFWGAYVEQINLIDRGSGAHNMDVEIVPRAGDQVVMIGNLDGYAEKLDKLLFFYRKALPYEGWDAYRYINLKYKNQIVCTR